MIAPISPAGILSQFWKQTYSLYRLRRKGWPEQMAFRFYPREFVVFFTSQFHLWKQDAFIETTPWDDEPFATEKTIPNWNWVLNHVYRLYQLLIQYSPYLLHLIWNDDERIVISLSLFVAPFTKKSTISCSIQSLVLYTRSAVMER